MNKKALIIAGIAIAGVLVAGTIVAVCLLTDPKRKEKNMGPDQENITSAELPGDNTDKDKVQNLTVEALREKYPEYFDLGDFKGLELYVVPDGDGQFRFKLMSGTNRMKTKAEIEKLPGTTVEEMRVILSTYKSPESSVFIHFGDDPVRAYNGPVPDRTTLRQQLFGEQPTADASDPEDAAYLEELWAKYPEFFDLDTTNGLIVFATSFGGSDTHFSLSCTIMPGNYLNDIAEQDVMLESLRWKTAPPEIIRAVIKTYDISLSDVRVVPYQHLCSSYLGPWNIIDPETGTALDYSEILKDMIFYGKEQ